MPQPPPAQWHPDPFGRHELRYWDGSNWTDHVSSHGRQSVDAPVVAPRGGMSPQIPAAWFSDPYGLHQLRYWDGSQWTDHVTSRERREIYPPAAVPAASPVNRPSKKVGRQARRAGVSGGEAGGGTLFTETVLVVNQKAKLIGFTVAYDVYDRNGQQLGAVREIGHGLATPLETRRFQVVDLNNRILLALTRPRGGRKSSMVVEGPGGTPIGQIVEETRGWQGSAAKVAQTGLSALGGVSRRLDSAVEDVDKYGEVRFGLEAGGQRLASIHAKERSWAWDFQILDAAGTEIALITKSWAGWAKERFTKADNYVVVMHRPLEDPLRSLVIAAAVVVDVELKQGVQTRGSSWDGTRRYQ